MTLDDLAASASQVVDLGSFQDWSRGPLRAVSPHTGLLCGQFFHHAGGLSVLERCTVDVPASYLQGMERPLNNLSSPLLARLLNEPEKSQFFDASEDAGWGNNHPEWLQRFHQAGWRNCLAFAYSPNESKDLLTAASFYNVPPQAANEAAALRNRVMPAVHMALCNWYPAARSTPKPASPKLTEAESAIVALLCQGESNKQIAKALGKSDQTVKHQVSGVMKKFGVCNRTTLVSRLEPLQ